MQLPQRRHGDAQIGEQEIRNRLGGAGEQIEEVPRVLVEAGSAREDRVAHRGGQRVARVIEHLGDEEGVTAGEAMQPARVDGPFAHQSGHRPQSQRRQRDRRGHRTAGNVTEQLPDGTVDTDLVVAGGQDHQRRTAPHPSQHEAQQVHRALVSPVQVVDHQGRGSRLQVGEHRVEHLVGVFGVVEHRPGVLAESPRQVVDRSEWPWCGQRIAGAPQHPDLTGPIRQEGLDERRLARTSLPEHQNKAALPGDGLRGPGGQRREFGFALQQRHGQSVAASQASEQRKQSSLGVVSSTR